MGNPNVSIFSPDKLIKDYQWASLTRTTKFAKGKLLDIGCGNKPYKSIYIQYVTKYVGIDKRGIEADIKKDFLDANIAKSSYNTVLCTQVLEYTPDPLKFLNKIYKILKKGGILIATVPFTGSLHEEPYDYFRFTQFGLRYLLNKAGFKIIYIRPEGNWISSIAQEQIIYLESTYNRYLLRYPKRLIQLGIQLIARLLSKLPE